MTAADVCGAFLATLPECLEASGESARAVVSITRDGVDEMPWGALHARARKMASVLSRRGVGPGTTVALLGTTSSELITALRASWLTGAAVTLLPVPMRVRSLDSIVQASVERIRHVDAAAVVLDPLAASVLGEPARALANVWILDELARSARAVPSERFSPPPVSPDDTAVLQFTSGTTDEPKAIELSHRMILANLHAIRAGAEVDPDVDAGLSWLPLYHDMGLIGFLLLPMVTSMRAAFADPALFIGFPGRWLDWITTFRPTAIGAPDFAYSLVARLLEAGRRRYDMSSVRVAFNGAEPINPATVRRFSAAAAPHGFDPGAVHCVYGMAEATLAVTFPQLGRGLRTDVVDAEALEGHAVALPDVGGRQRELVRLGRAVAGLEVRIVDPESEQMVENCRVGEVRIRGASVMERYHRRPEVTAGAFDSDGWLRTGDLGYSAEGELVICGRLKDVIIVGGRNIYPEELERAVEIVPSVRSGNVVAFSLAPLDGAEAFVVAAEVRGDTNGVARDIRAAALDAVGVRPRDVVLLRPGLMPKTSSGKVQRSMCRELYRRGELAPRT